MTLAAVPSNDPIVNGGDGEDAENVSLSWLLFFNQCFNGDAGTDWLPDFVNLAFTGAAPTIKGRYYQLSQYIAIFVITVTPSSGGSITGTVGSTYIDNFPLQFQTDGPNFTVSGGQGGAVGQNVAANNRIFPCGFNAVTVPLTIVGIGPAQ